MSDETRVTIVGRLAADPDLRYTQSGAPVANFKVISTARKFDKDTGKWVDGASVSFRVDCWRSLAENVAESLSKGSLVMVVGRLEERNYQDKTGATRYVIELQAEHVGASLQWDKVKILRAERSSSDRAVSGSAGSDDPWDRAAARSTTQDQDSDW